MGIRIWMIRFAACLTAGVLGYGLPVLGQTAGSVSSGLTGTVINGSSGTPLIGAKITIGTFTGWSVSGGQYLISGIQAGTYVVHCQKPGYVPYDSAPVNIPATGTTTLNISMEDAANPPVMASASLDTVLWAVPVNWSAPTGDYELLYDDGIQEDLTVWATQGNMNGMRFTPLGYPVVVTGGSVNIGAPSDYPPGSSPLVPFQIAVYDATGPNSMPGNLIGGPFVIIPMNFGWIEFTLTSAVTVNSGQFYLIMIQGGNAPNAAGLAVDNTSPALRSVSRNLSGGGPWIPGNGNFMIRAKVNGPGGPGVADGYPDNLQQYQVWRLRQGEEMNPVVWTSIGLTQLTSITDFSWPSLPCGPYRWGIRAQYTGNRWSPTTFSNIVAKCWTVPITVGVELSCQEASSAGVSITLTNLVYPDTIYQATLDSAASVTFPSVWKGTYQVTADRFGYEEYNQTVSVSASQTLLLFLLQKRNPPRNITVTGQNLMTAWQPPEYHDTLFSESWNSGDFTTQGWTLSPGFNWLVSASFGNPAPSAQFNWFPQATNYDLSLTSRIIEGVHSPALFLEYDIFLDNFSTTTVNEMAVEIWSGGQWSLLKNYDNSGGSIPWTNENIDITEYTGNNFRIRFRAHGEDTYDINRWNTDNIHVIAAESPAGITQCVLGYNFYLDNVLTAFTTDTAYAIPGNLVQYGNNYTACVLTAYGSGYSELACDTFTSAFLWPVYSLTAEAVENAAYMAWKKPQMVTDTGFAVPPGILGYEIYRDGSLVHSVFQPDSLEWYDMNLEPATYSYTVTALYDLSFYGYPGQTAESWPDGPVYVEIIYGRPLPFFEPWDNGTFSFNEWRFTPEQGNWIIQTPEGNPPPAATFSREPQKLSYSYAMESPALDASPYQCALIWLDFDLKLEDLNITNEEQLYVEIFYDQAWHEKTVFKNTGSFDWINCHLDIRAVKGKAFRVRFRAAGVNSGDIMYWMVDNIHIYGECFPASDLAGDVQGYNVILTWSPPECSGGACSLDEGFEEPEFPPPGWTQYTTNVSVTWSHINAASPVGVHNGNWAAGINTAYEHQDEWLVVSNVLAEGDLQFWSYAYQGSVKGDHFYVQISTDGGLNWNPLLDLSSLPLYPSTSGYNVWETPYVVDLSAYQGQVVDLAWIATDSNGMGLWYVWAIDDCALLTDDGSRSLMGYNVFRRDNGTGDFLRVNGDPVTDTTYTDFGLNAGQYEYFVSVLHQECADTVTSDTVLMDVITGTDPPGKPTVRIFPNPVSGNLIVESETAMREIAVVSSLGQVIRTLRVPGVNRWIVDFSDLPAGLYRLKITSDKVFEVINAIRVK